MTNLDSGEQAKPPPEKLGTAIYELFKSLGGAEPDLPWGADFRIPTWAIWDWPEEEGADDYS